MVVIDMQIPLALEVQRHASMLGQSCKHLKFQPKSFQSTYMIEEPNPGRDLDDLRSDTGLVVEINGAGDLGLASLALYRCCT